MKRERRFQETIRVLQHQWPLFVGLYGGIVVVLIVIGLSLQRGWFGFVPIGLAFIIILGSYLGSRLWAIYHLYDNDGLRPHDFLFDLGQIQDTDTVVYLDIGNRRRALNLMRRLTTGKMIIIDLYNPQWMPNPDLVRQRKTMPTAVPDPRITWKESQIKLLPLPDESVSYVMAVQVIGELWQRGDQEQLLKEIYRVLKPNGRLLIAERIQNKTNLALLEGFSMPTNIYWQSLLKENGFKLQRQANLRNLIHCYRAIKPTPYEARQMALELNYES